MLKKILIVEDDKFLGELYQHQFARRGFETILADTGTKGLNAAKSQKFDCILLDIMLPEMDGIEILKNLKQDPSTKDSTVVILSNLGQDDLIKQALQIGAKAYIIKSLYTPDQVVAEILSILDQ